MFENNPNYLIGIFGAFLINFLNEAFSVIFKHCDVDVDLRNSTTNTLFHKKMAMIPFMASHSSPHHLLMLEGKTKMC